MVMITQKLNVWRLLKKSFLASACIACSVAVVAEEVQPIGGLYYSIKEASKTATITGFDSETMPSKLNIPDSVQIGASRYEVTSIGNNAFRRCSGLESVSMPEVTSIGEYAFYDCSALSSVSMPEVTSILENAFYDCSALSSVSMPKVTSVGKNAFRGCKSLVSVSMLKVTSIGENAFQGCKSLVSVSMPEVTSLESFAFYSCSVLSSVSIPKVASLEAWVFCDCSSLESVSMYNVTRVKKGAFNGCPQLNAIELGQSDPTMIEIDESVFEEVSFGNVTLYVPTGSKSDYESVFGINIFKEIKEKDSIDDDATYVIVIDKEGVQHNFEATENVKVKWVKGAELGK